MNRVVFEPYENKPALILLNGVEFPVIVIEKSKCNRFYRCEGKTGAVYQVKFEQLIRPKEG